MKQEKLKIWSEKVDNYLAELLNDFEKNAEKFGDVYFFEYLPKYNVGSALSTIISLKKSNKTVIIMNMSGDKIKINFRRQDGKENMNKLAQFATQGIGSGGGHAKASGGIIEGEMKEVFKQRVKQWIKEKVNG